MTRNSKPALLALAALLVGGTATFVYLLFHKSAAELSYERGVQLSAIRMEVEARDAYMEAIKRDPKFAPPYQALAELAAAGRRFDVSADYWRDYLARAPKGSHGACRLSLVELAAGLETQALDDAEAELRSDPRCARANLAAGALYAKKSDPKNALDHLQVAAAAYPNDLRVQLEYARVLALTADYSHSESALKSILEKDKSHAQPYLWLGYVYSRRSPDAESSRLAEQSLKAALDLQPDMPETNYEMARLLFNEHSPERALPFIEKAVKLKSHYPAGLYLLGKVFSALNRQQDADRAQAAFRRESDLAAREKALLRKFGMKRDDVETALSLAQVEIARGKPEGAKAILSMIQQALPTDRRIQQAVQRAQSLRTAAGGAGSDLRDDSSIFSSITELATKPATASPE